MRRIIHGAVLVHIVIAVVVIGALVLGVGAIQNHLNPAAASKTLYCSSDGTLSDTKPIQSHRSYCLKVLTQESSIQPGILFTFSFSIVDDEGNTLKSFEVDREKPLHFIVIRKDLQQFQHVHPELDVSTGVFTLTDFAFPTAGSYMLYADFVTPLSQKGPDGNYLNAVVMKDLTVSGSYQPRALGAPEQKKMVDRYTVTLNTDLAQLTAAENMLSFSIGKDGKPVVNLEEYLAALGHAVVLRDTSLEYIHAHAIENRSSKQTGTINFHVEFPFGGNYKVFLQFKHNGKVKTIDFVLPTVSGENPDNSAMDINTPGMDHTMTPEMRRDMEGMMH